MNINENRKIHSEEVSINVVNIHLIIIEFVFEISIEFYMDVFIQNSSSGL